MQRPRVRKKRMLSKNTAVMRLRKLENEAWRRGSLGGVYFAGSMVKRISSLN
jgi:hypothetical protein